MKKLLVAIVSTFCVGALFGQTDDFEYEKDREVMSFYDNEGGMLWQTKTLELKPSEDASSRPEEATATAEIVRADWYANNVYVPSYLSLSYKVACNNYFEMSISKIGDETFANNNRITSVVIPSSQIAFGKRVFANSPNLTLVVLENLTELPQADTEAFTNVSENCTLLVDCDETLLQEFKSSAVWNKFANIINTVNAPELPIDEELTIGDEPKTINLSEYVSNIAVSDWDVSSDPGVVVQIEGSEIVVFPITASGEDKYSVYAWSSTLSTSIQFDFTVAEAATPCNVNVTIDTSVPNQAEAIVTGGSGEYTYRWSNGNSTNKIYNFPMGTYDVFVDDGNGCRAFASFDYYDAKYLDAYVYVEKQPDCGENNGIVKVMNVFDAEEPISYLWSTGATTQTLENLAAGLYWVKITDATGASTQIEVALNSEGVSYHNSIIDNSKSERSYCENPTGITIFGNEFSIETPNGTFDWNSEGCSFMVDGNIPVVQREVMFHDGLKQAWTVYTNAGKHYMEFTDPQGCKYVHNYEVNRYLSYPQIPKISSVMVGEKSEEVLVTWNKEYNEDIKQYNLYRERAEEPGEYDKIAEIPYSQMPVYADIDADPNAGSYRYKLSATDYCGEETDKTTHENKTIFIKNMEQTESGEVTLKWDAYEGQTNFVKYVLYRVKQKSLEEVAVLPFTTTEFTEIVPTDELIRGYRIGVRFTNEIYPEDHALSKAESGPYSIALSNIAELENFSGFPEEPQNANTLEHSGIIVRTQGKTIVVSGATELVEVYNVVGQKITIAEPNANEIRIPIKKSGVYSVVIGKNAFKTIIK